MFSRLLLDIFYIPFLWKYNKLPHDLAALCHNHHYLEVSMSQNLVQLSDIPPERAAKAAGSSEGLPG